MRAKPAVILEGLRLWRHHDQKEKQDHAQRFRKAQSWLFWLERDATGGRLPAHALDQWRQNLPGSLVKAQLLWALSEVTQGAIGVSEVSGGVWQS